MERDANLMEMLHRLDDPEWPEFPSGYDETRIAASFSRLAILAASDLEKVEGVL